MIPIFAAFGLKNDTILVAVRIVVRVKVKRAHSFMADINSTIFHKSQLACVKNVKMLRLFGLEVFILISPRRQFKIKIKM